HTSAWMKTDDGMPVSGARLISRIQTYIDRVVNRYAGVVAQWDVVNEALADSGGELLRDSVYSRTTGDEFIVAAFEAAREKAPNALLIYNDYNCEMPEKRKKLLALLQSLKAKGAPVDAVGMQGHFELGDKSLQQLRETFDELRRINMKVIISEL